MRRPRKVTARRDLPECPRRGHAEQSGQFAARGVRANVLAAADRKGGRVDGAPVTAVEVEGDLEAVWRRDQQVVHVVRDVVQGDEQTRSVTILLTAGRAESGAEEGQIEDVDAAVVVQIGGWLEARIALLGAVVALQQSLVVRVRSRRRR